MNHVDEPYDAGFLNVLEAHVTAAHDPVRRWNQQSLEPVTGEWRGTLVNT